MQIPIANSPVRPPDLESGTACNPGQRETGRRGRLHPRLQEVRYDPLADEARKIVRSQVAL